MHTMHTMHVYLTIWMVYFLNSLGVRFSRGIIKIVGGHVIRGYSLFFLSSSCTKIAPIFCFEQQNPLVTSAVLILNMVSSSAETSKSEKEIYVNRVLFIIQLYLYRA